MQKVTDHMTVYDKAIYDRMPMVGRLMVHRDRRDARIMYAHTVAAVIQDLSPAARIAHQIP